MFRDRHDAGLQLADALSHFSDKRAIVYALPRGGVAVAAPVAKALRVPLDLILVRKLGAPQYPELAIGAVVDGAAPITYLNDDVIAELRVSKDYIESAKTKAIEEINRRRKLYFGDRPPHPAKGFHAIVIDDGIATGATMEAALLALKRAGAQSVTMAVPVAPGEALSHFREVCDEVVCLIAPTSFGAVGLYYREFPQLTDIDVIKLLAAANSGQQS